MPMYAVTNSTAIVAGAAAQQAVAATYKSLIVVAGSTSMVNPPAQVGGPRRSKLYDILVGTNGTPADNFMEFDVIRATVGTTLAWVGSLSSISSGFALDLADTQGFSNLVFINSTAETNIVSTQEPWYVGVNQRASYRWVAAPGSEIVAPATSSATAGSGLALRTRSGGYTGTATGAIMVSEM